MGIEVSGSWASRVRRSGFWTGGVTSRVWGSFEITSGGRKGGAVKHMS